VTATLTTLVSFPYATSGPGSPLTDLITDSSGDLFGISPLGPYSNDDGDPGVVFEIAKTAGGYASTPTTLSSFAPDGTVPQGGLITDSSGDLFGTAQNSGPNYDGTVFEIEKTPDGYASTPTTLASFDDTDGSAPQTLMADAKGDLFGVTASGGANEDGTVFEIAKTPTGYASAPSTLASFNDTDGQMPQGSLIADAKGDLFGVTAEGGATGEVGSHGTVFEIAKTGAGYASRPTTLVSFNIFFGAATPVGGLIADANGDLFGTTEGGGGDVSGDPLSPFGGTVFEIVKTSAGYASTAKVLAAFDGPNGSQLVGGLIADAAGDLFGTTSDGGADSLDGTVFEIKKTSTGYASTPTTLVSFDDADGSDPQGSLIADANGDLLGTTPGGRGAAANGTVFEITDSGFVTAGSGTPAAATSDILWQTASGQAAIWDMSGTNIVGGGTIDTGGIGVGAGGGFQGLGFREVGAADFSGDGHPYLVWQRSDGAIAIMDMSGTNVISDGYFSDEDPGPAWKAVGTGDFNRDGISDILLQNTNTGQASIWETNDGGRIAGGGPVTPNPGPSWKAIGTGDFNDDGFSDILWQNTNTGQVSIWEMDGTSLMGGGPVTPNPGPSWQAIGTGDFNHDGFSDILLQNKNTGAVSVWEMNGNNLIGGGPVANPGTSWHAIGTGAGGSDILLQNTSGQTSIWEMNGNTIADGGPVSPNPGTNWHAVGLT
jgi:hypothetical protein